jgi:hypothetical protein
VQCSVFIAISLDGYIARTGGGIDGRQRFHQSIGKTGRDLPLTLVAGPSFDSGLVQLEYQLAAAAGP